MSVCCNVFDIRFTAGMIITASIDNIELDFINRFDLELLFN